MSESVTLDSIDSAILRELQKDGRLANKVLAGRVGIAPSTCLARTQRLQRAGVISGFHAKVSPQAVGRGIEAVLAVQFVAHSRPLVDPFVAWAQALPETRSLQHVTGPDDFLVQVACADTADLQQLVLAFTARQEVGRLQTYLVFASWEGGPVLAPQGRERRGS
ncbi:Lrp/AsnC family transcriptional regulator [Streptomyces bathyalis]|uniref:Lrp/AsnC family transcriptional regulator n=1 Tax=Streptomyces bathyalis TaxID=2710756 RepID=A0A7T1T3Y8_9ACTN|nr:Lrp/AsnC family transcriptional regulator [Streptomyces bathyalis]QPP05957.1 Lrp/AsnC family transcriptional regulator [Streptomyces bathyalis]